MSNSEYQTFIGDVQFDPETRDVNGKKVTQVNIRLANNSQDVKVRITIWPELKVGPIKKGDGILVGGKYSTNTSQDGSRTFHNVSATNIVVFPAVVKDAAPVVQRAATADAPAF